MTLRPILLLLPVLGATLLFTTADAQPPAEPRRIGFLGFTSPGIESRAIGTLKARLEELDFIDGKNVTILYRWADWDRVRYPALGQELLRLNVDVITAPCGWGLEAVRRASPTVPVAARCIGLPGLGAEIRDGERAGCRAHAITLRRIGKL